MDRSSSSELLKTQEEELKALRAENDALKKAHEEELKTLRDEKAALTKSHEDELAKVKAQAEAGLAEQSERARKALAEVRQERDVLKQTLADVLADPRTPHQVRTVSDLEVKVVQVLPCECAVLVL
jgi:DNA anti-recombination protein RmuC